MKARLSFAGLQVRCSLYKVLLLNIAMIAFCIASEYLLTWGDRFNKIIARGRDAFSWPLFIIAMVLSMFFILTPFNKVRADGLFVFKRLSIDEATMATITGIVSAIELFAVWSLWGIARIEFAMLELKDRGWYLTEVSIRYFMGKRLIGKLMVPYMFGMKFIVIDLLILVAFGFITGYEQYKSLTKTVYETKEGKEK